MHSLPQPAFSCRMLIWPSTSWRGVDLASPSVHNGFGRGDSMRSPCTLPGVVRHIATKRYIRGVCAVVTLFGFLFGAVASDPPSASCQSSLSSGATDTSSLETFIPDCELYLFGRLVPPIDRDGRSGLLVKLEGNVITINGRVYMEVQPIEPAEPDPSPYDETVRPSIRVRILATNAVRRSRVEARGADSLTVGDQAVPIGEFVPMVVETGDSVLVAYFVDFFEIRVETYTYRFRYVEEPRKPPDNSPEAIRSRAVGLYAHLARGLKPGAIVLLGEGYQSSYRDPSEFEELRAALSQIPLRAQRLSSHGIFSYRGLDIGPFRFLPSVVQDFVDASEASQ